MDNSKKDLENDEIDIDEKISKLERSILEKVANVTDKSRKHGIKDADSCYAACPSCVTRCCRLLQGHYGQHECPEGHRYY